MLPVVLEKKLYVVDIDLEKRINVHSVCVKVRNAKSQKRLTKSRSSVGRILIRYASMHVNLSLPGWQTESLRTVPMKSLSDCLTFENLIPRLIAIPTL